MAHVEFGSCEKINSKEFYRFEKLNEFKTNTLIYHRINQDEKQYSFADVIAEGQKFASLLHSNVVGENVGIALHVKEHTPALCATLIGILNRNCFFCPVANFKYTSPECIAQQMRRQDACFLLSDKTFLNVSSLSSVFNCDIFGESLVLYKSNLVENNHVEQPIFPIKICYCIATSGTTGSPKAVYVPYSCIAPNVEAISNLLVVSAHDVVLLYAPITFDPFVIELFLALYNGAALIITSNEIRLNPNELLGLMFPSAAGLRGATILQITPSLFRLIIEASKRDNVPSIFDKNNSLRALLLGGENFPSLKEWSKWLPKHLFSNEKRIFNIYGITEVSCWTTIHELKKDDQRIPLGHALENDTKLRIIDDQGVEICGQGIGELQIGSASRKCYLAREEAEYEAKYKTQVQYRGTGDLVERDEKSQLYYIGRLKNTIKRFGVQICLDLITANIEKILCDRSASVACAFDDKNKELTVFIAMKKRDAMQEQSCRISIMEKLDSHEKPDVIKFLDHFPLTIHGKKSVRQILSHAKAKKTPLEKFNQFLIETLGIKYSADIHAPALNSKEKRLKQDLNLSFIAAGGSSFHALNLATEIGSDLVNVKDQQQFLKMVFDENVSLKNILIFLNTVPTANIYREEYTLPTESSSPEKLVRLQVAWRVNLQKCVDATPSAFDFDEFSFICVGSHSHLVLTLNGCTGNQIASLTLPDRIEGTVEFISNNMALVGCYDGHLYAFDFRTGKLHWDFDFGGMIKSKPIHFQNCIIVASYAEEFNLSCITLDGQTIKWTKRIGTKGILATPLLLRNSFLIVCALDGKYVCMDAETGTCIWEKNLKSPIFSNAATAFKETEIVIAEVSGAVNICNASNGEIVARYDADGNIFSGITLQHIDKNNAFIIFGCHDHNVYCLKYNKDDKFIALHWKYNLTSPIYSTPRILKIKLENGFVCTCSTKGVVVILELTTGYLVSKYDLGANVFSSPCVAKSEDKIYIGSYPCHSQNTECFVHVVHESAMAVTDEQRMGHILSKLESLQKYSQLETRRNLMD